MGMLHCVIREMGRVKMCHIFVLCSCAQPLTIVISLNVPTR